MPLNSSRANQECGMLPLPGAGPRTGGPSVRQSPSLRETTGPTFNDLSERGALRRGQGAVLRRRDSRTAEPRLCPDFRETQDATGSGPSGLSSHLCKVTTAGETARQARPPAQSHETRTACLRAAAPPTVALTLPPIAGRARWGLGKGEAVTGVTLFSAK